MKNQTKGEKVQKTVEKQDTTSYMELVMSKEICLDSCMTAAILIGDSNPENHKITLVDLAIPDKLGNENIACIECGGTGDIAKNNWDHHYYRCMQNTQLDGSPVIRRILYFDRLAACTQAAQIKLKSIPPVVKAIENWTFGINYHFEFKPEIPDIFSGMLLSTKDTMKQVITGIKLCQKWLKEDFSYSKEEEKWMKTKKKYDKIISDLVENVELIETRGGEELAYIWTSFEGASQGIQNRLGTGIIIVGNLTNGKITITLDPEKTWDVEFICNLLNRLNPGWHRPNAWNVIESPPKWITLRLEEDVVQIVRLFL